MNSNARFIVSQSLVDNFYYELITARGELLLRMNGFPDKAVCLLAVEVVRRFSANSNLYARKAADTLRYYFELRDVQRAVIGVSSLHKSIITRDRAINMVQGMAASALLDDQAGD